MTSIGNDIVDLISPDSIGKSGDRRFIARVFTPEEQERIERSASPDTTLWMLWAAKEAAFKAASKLKPGMSFVHRAYAVARPLNEDSLTGDTSNSFTDRSFQPGHTVNRSHLPATECGPCCDCRQKSLAHHGSGKGESILLKETNGEAIPIQGRALVMTPAGPVDAFFTLSPQRVHCVAVVRNGHGGAPAAVQVQVREERREGPFDPSAAVRRAAIHHLASILKASPYYIDLRRDETPHGYGAPRVFIEGSRTDIDISLSHDGRYIAFAVRC